MSTKWIGGSEEREKELKEFWSMLWLSNWTEKEHLKTLDQLLPKKEEGKCQITSNPVGTSKAQ